MNWIPLKRIWRKLLKSKNFIYYRDLSSNNVIYVCKIIFKNIFILRLRTTDVKAEHFERKCNTLESEKADLEKKLDEKEQEFKKKEEELEATLKQLEDM